MKYNYCKDRIEPSIFISPLCALRFRKYKIPGACNSAYAYKALQKEDKIGVKLPCNVIIQEQSNGTIEVATVDPVASMSAIENPELKNIALDIQKK